MQPLLSLREIIMTKNKKWPFYSDVEIDAVTKVLRSGKVNYWTGEECRKFEEEFSAICKTKFAISLMNGTVALELALRATGVKANDEVLVTPRSFFASVSAIVAIGAVPVFADIEIGSGNISIRTIKSLISSKTRAIICVHLAGIPVDIDPIFDFVKNKDIYIIEDCAQAHGAIYKGRPVGSLGHIAAWSFCQDKIISTGGEGGMITTNDKDLWEKAWSYKDHGKSWNSTFNNKHGVGFRWLHDNFGSNFRMTEMQAAIGRIQLTFLKSWIDQRNINANLIMDDLKYFEKKKIIRFSRPLCFDCKFSSNPCQDTAQYCKHAYYKFYIFVENNALRSGWNRDRILTELDNNNIYCLSGSCPEMYLEKAFEKTNYKPKSRLANAKLLGEQSLMFQVDPSKTKTELRKMTSTLKVILQKAAKNNIENE